MSFETIQLPVGGFDGNFSYVLKNRGQAAVIDPTGDLEMILGALAALEPRFILITHGHRDHVEQLANLRSRFDIPALRFENLKDGELIPLGDGKVQALFTPGHSPDGVCYLAGNALFTGDTLFVDYIGFGKVDELYESLKRLRGLPDDTLVYPGHDYGRAPYSTIGAEKRGNPFFREQTLAEFREIYKTLD